MRKLNLQNRREHIYGRKYGLALTLESFQPTGDKNGSTVVLILSEGWFSDSKMIEPLLETIVGPLLSKGYTVFAVTHGSSPKFTMREAIEDVHRSIRYIRHNSEHFAIDPERIGVVGWSAGGQLAYSLASQSIKTGNTDDPVDLQSSHIAACSIYFPITDFLNWGKKGNHMIGNHPSFPLYGAFDFDRLNENKQCFERITDTNKHLTLSKSLSPIEWVKKEQAPTCISTGDDDEVVPPQQSENLAIKMAEVDAVFEHNVISGGKHDVDTVAANLSKTIDWFEKHL